MTKYRKVQIPIYFGTLHIAFSKNFVKTAKKFKVELKDSANDYLGLAVRISDKKACKYLILINRNTPDVIAHEALHITNYILEDCGITIDTTNDEVQAYLLGWVVTQVIKTK